MDPLNRAEVYEKITEAMMDRFEDNYGSDSERWLEAEIARYAQAKDIPFMRGATVDDYNEYIWQQANAKSRRREEERNVGLGVSPQEFFEAALDFDPVGKGMHSRDTLLAKLQRSGRVPPIPLGKIYGDKLYYLIPGADSLPRSVFNVEGGFRPNYNVAQTDSVAINYPDNHPSQEYARGSSRFNTVMSHNDGFLRRVWSLGFLAERLGDDHWERTGHAVVMDMGRDRAKHPWIILASHWPNSNGGDDGDFIVRAKSQPRRDEPGVHGIFRGDTKRTPIAKLMPLEDKGDKRHLFKQFGPDFNLYLYRRGGLFHTVYNTKRYREYHPDLVRVMGWYWDATAKVEMCYAENGKELLCYDRVSGNYKPGDMAAATSVGGSIALFGQVAPDRRPEAAGLVDLQERLEWSPANVVPNHSQEITGSGFD